MLFFKHGDHTEISEQHRGNLYVAKKHQALSITLTLLTPNSKNGTRMMRIKSGFHCAKVYPKYFLFDPPERGGYLTGRPP